MLPAWYRIGRGGATADRQKAAAAIFSGYNRPLDPWSPRNRRP